MPKKPTKVFDDFLDQGIRPLELGNPRDLLAPQFDGPQFDKLIRSKGLRFIHRKAALCPNVRDIRAQDHDPNCSGCEDGFVYFNPTCVMGVFSNNKLERMYEINGRWDVGEAIVTFESYKPDPITGEAGTGGNMNDFQMNDKVICIDYTVTWQELIEHNPSGVDRLQYPAKTIEYIADKNRVYVPDVDVKVNADGHLEWISSNRPLHDQDINRGTAVTVTYTHNPVFIVMHVMHELRATQGKNRDTGNVEAIRLPQQVLLRRDFLYEHPSDTQGLKEARKPRDNEFVPS